MLKDLKMGLDCGIYDNSRAITELVKAGWQATIGAGAGGSVRFALVPPAAGKRRDAPIVGEGQTLNVAIRRCLDKVSAALAKGK